MIGGSVGRVVIGGVVGVFVASVVGLFIVCVVAVVSVSVAGCVVVPEPCSVSVIKSASKERRKFKNTTSSINSSVHFIVTLFFVLAFSKLHLSLFFVCT